MMVSDGLGPASQSYARSFRQYKKNYTAEEAVTSLDEILIGASRTRSSNSLVTDSAAGATAFSCALKTYNAAVGVDPEGIPCGTVLEAAKEMNMFTGLVVTSRVTHATPASFSAHVVHRDMEADIAVHQIGDYALGRRVDLLLGGGRCFFLPNTTEGSCRQDDRDLIKESKSFGWENVIFNRQQLEDMMQKNEDALPLPLLGLFHLDHMSYEVDRKRRFSAEEPPLNKMTEAALKTLKTNAQASGQGFFLMIEGSKIDLASHSNDPVAHLHEILEYHRTIRVVRNFLKENPDTVMISTSDHETGGFTLGLQPDPRTYPDYLWKPEVIDRAEASAELLGKKLVAFLASESREDQRAQDPNGNHHQRIEEFVKTEILEKGLHITDPSEEEIKFLSTADTQPFDYLLRFIGRAISKRAYLGWTTAGHTGVDVNLYAESSQDQDDWILDRLRGNHENTDIGDFLTWYLNLDLEPITKRLVG
ncbi:MAG: alkaline phosphatase [Benniella sp.]|nr:MAG: alkaline phosphatase [Benniella sp.]